MADNATVLITGLAILINMDIEPDWPGMMMYGVVVVMLVFDLLKRWLARAAAMKRNPYK